MKKVVLFIFLMFISLPVYAKEEVTLNKCVDGDTIKINYKGKVETIRMLAVDTPESVHPTKKVEYYGKDASEYTCTKFTNASSIEIEYDDNSDEKDKYGRLLVWLFVDNKLYQEDLVENGYAKVAYLYGKYKYTSILEEKEKIAKANNLGVWNESAKASYNEVNGIEEDLEEQEETTNMKEILIGIGILILLSIIGYFFKGTKKTNKKLSKKITNSLTKELEKKLKL